MSGNPADRTGRCPECDGLLEAGTECRRCLVGVAWFEAPVEEDAAPVEPSLGQMLGGYELLSRLGAGGMGIVYRARQRATGRIVALKTLRLEVLPDQAAVERFQTEIKLAAALEHPHVLPFYEVGAQDGLPFFSMKIVEGSLADRLRAGPLPPREAALLLTQVARAVHHAHQHGVLHRDLKPANILVDAAGSPFIADFGVARFLDASMGVTRTGALLGTPAYMSPEQAEGRALTVASDVYSLGAVLFETLTGTVPFAADSALATMKQVVERAAPSPSTRRTGIPDDLAIVCLKALAKEPAARYESAAALADDLERWRDGRGILARRSSRAERLARWARRNPALAGVSGLLALALLAVSIISTLSSVRVGRALERALAAEQERRGEVRTASLAQARASKLTGRIGQRFDALEALKRAAAIRPGLDLREEALAVLALPDAIIQDDWEPRYTSNAAIRFDGATERYVVEAERGVLSLRHFPDHAELQRFAVPEGSPRVRYIAQFAAGETRFAARFADGSVRVYEVGQDEPLCEIQGGLFRQAHVNFLLDFGLSADGRELLVGRPEGGVAYYEVTTGREVGRLETTTVPAIVALSPAGDRIALCGLRDERVEIYDHVTGRLLFVLPHPAGVFNCVWRPDGAELACACQDRQIHLWNALTGAPGVTLRGHVDVPIGLAYRRDGRVLASGAMDLSTRLWRCSDGAELLAIPRLGGSQGLAFSHDGAFVVTTSEGPRAWRLRLHLADVRQAIYDGTPGDHFDDISGLDVSRDGRLLVLASQSGVRLLDAASGDLLVTLEATPRAAGGTARIEAVLADGTRGDEKTAQFSPDGRTLVYSVTGTGTWARNLNWRDDRTLEIGPPRQIDARHGLVVLQVAGDPALVVLSGARAPIASVLPLKGGGSPVDYPLSGVPSNCVIAPGRNFVVTADHVSIKPGESDVRLWEYPSGKLVRRLNLGRDGNIQFSPDGMLLFACGDAGAGLFRWPGLEAVAALAKGSQEGWFSPDGSLLVVRDDAGLALTRIATREVLGHLPAARRLDVRFDPAGVRLFTLIDVNLYAWNLPAVRRELARIGLDWEDRTVRPALPSSASSVGRIVVRIEEGEQASR